MTTSRRSPPLARGLAILALTALLAGCNLISGAGPTGEAIRDDGVAIDPAARPEARYALVRMDLPLVDMIDAAWPAPPPTGDVPADTAPARSQLTIGPGDAIGVTIVNVSQTGFVDFTESAISPLATTDLPPQQVGPDGRISVPPLGRVPAAGRTPQVLERELQARLAEILVEPEVVVRLAERRNRQAAVMGAVADPGYFPILSEDTRLLDLVGAAGGPVEPPEEVELALRRGGRERRVRFDVFLRQPDWNVRVWPGDVITLAPAERRYTLLGASVLNGEFTYTEPTLTLAQALGRGRGLDNFRAERSGVFLFRETPRAALRRAAARPLPFEAATVPTIYHFDFSRPAVLFAAQRFEIRDGDMIYVPDSPLAELSKVLSAFNLAGQAQRNVLLLD
jgi:polysaccharide export outer membrane protein